MNWRSALRFLLCIFVGKATPKPWLNATAESEDFAGLLPLARAVLSIPWAVALLFLAGVLAPMPGIICKNGGGDGSSPSSLCGRGNSRLCPGGQACHPLGGGQVLQALANCVRSLGSTSHRDSAEGQLLEEHCRPVHLGSTAGWGKGCFLSCAAPRQTASPFPRAQAPSGWHTQERWQGSSLPVPAITVENRIPGAGHSCGTDEFGGEVVCFLHKMKLRPKAPRQTLGRQCC